MEDLAYRRLLDECYLHEQPLISGVEALARQIGMRDHVAEVQFVLECYFRLTDEGWVNTRAAQEIAKYKEYAAAGKRGAEKRWGGNNPPNPPPMQTINHKPLTNKKNIYATPDGVSDFVWQDFVILRKNKKAAITTTAINGFVREAAKAGITLEAALRLCCERGWTGFKADWLHGNKPANEKNLAAARTIFGDERSFQDGNIIDI
jgi:uncharacterized protein YdaU (DUF1376 family)